MHHPFVAFFLALLCCLTGLTGCSDPPPPSPLRVGTNLWVGYEPLYLARALGHYNNTPIRMAEFTNTTDVMQALRNGQLEAAALTLDEALYLASEGQDLRVVLVFDYSAGADALMARPEISTLAGLRGKRIGVETSAVGALMLQAVLEAANLGLQDIVKRPLTANEQVYSYQKGEVDAVIAFEPNLARLRQQGAHVLFDSRAIPGRIMDVLVVRADALPAQAESLQTLLKGYFAALDHLAIQPRDAHLRMSPRLGQDVASQLKGIHQPSLAENRTLLTQLDAKTRSLADFMRLHGLLPRQAEAQGLAADPAHLTD